MKNAKVRFPVTKDMLPATKVDQTIETVDRWSRDAIRPGLPLSLYTQ